jgi:hypothetical protein
MRWRRHGDPLVRLNPPAEHGTLAMYCNHHCRCDACRAANSRNQRRYMKENPEQYAKHLKRKRKAQPGRHRAP